MDSNDEVRSCRPCDLAWGILGVTAGLVLLYMGADLLSGGKLSSMLSGAASLAPVITLRSTDDSDAERA